jgi:hypothetical protein
MQLTQDRVLRQLPSGWSTSTDRHGSKASLATVAHTALVCLDETALFDTELCKAAKALLAASRAAIVSISPCDPAYLPTSDLLSESSFLLGALVTRFQAQYDPQCELSLNMRGTAAALAAHRAVPRLLRDIDGRTSVPSLLHQMEAKHGSQRRMIFTFYSYKGGVEAVDGAGNGVSRMLAGRGLSVLCVDFDLEAPGLEHYFFEGARAATSRGGTWA